MLGRLRGTRHSYRAWLIALFVACAMLLGGGGTPNPLTEVILQLLFVAVVVAWIWLDRNDAEPAAVDRGIVPLIAAILLLPVVQLVPLPPALWQALPGRADALAALELVGAADTWRPISLSPSRTLASLLAMIPAAFCIYAVATLSIAERRLVLLTIVAMVVAGGVLGMVQLLSGSEAINFYRIFSRGWVTGFQANRNAEADVLLIGLLALATFVAGRAEDGGAPARARPSGKSSTILAAAVGLFILATTVLTGSRGGIALALPVLAIIGLMAVPSLDSEKSHSFASLLVVAALPLLVAMLVFATALAGSVPIGRALARFGEFEDQRLAVWQDTMFAISYYWPVGVGTGVYPPAILAAERLEFVNRTFPNRAHNEYLEIGVESGFFGYLVVAATAAILVAMAIQVWRKVPRTRRQILFALGTLLVVGLHSAVDYPLRSMALATLAGVAAGMVTRPGRGPTDPRSIDGPAPRAKGYV